MYPVAVEYFFDKLQVGATTTISPNIINQLNKDCLNGCEEPPDDESSRFGRRHYVQTLRLLQPQPRALRQLARLPVVVNYVEPAIDWIFAPADHDAPEYFDKLFKDHFLQARHHPRAGVEFYPCGFSTRKTPKQGERKEGSWFQGYGDKPCRLPAYYGLPCYHFENRSAGVDYVRDVVGGTDPRDLLTFPFERHFDEWLRWFYAVDHERLGRYHCNVESSSRRQYANVTDAQLGAALYRAYSGKGTLQEFVHKYPARNRNRPFLTRLDGPPLYYVHRANCILFLQPHDKAPESSESIRRNDSIAASGRRL